MSEAPIHIVMEPPVCRCGMSKTRNPHPNAGMPLHLGDVGALWVCIPCTVKTMSDWSHRATMAENKLHRMKAYPDELTENLNLALGVPNFRTGPIAHALRVGGAKINNRCEDEQAYVLHWFVKLVLEHGDKWSDKVTERLNEITKRVKDIAEKRKPEKIKEAPMPVDKSQVKYLQYVRNTGGNATVENFDDDWEPVGPMVRNSIMPALVIVNADGKLELTEAGMAAIES